MTSKDRPTILVADDDPMIRRLISTICSDFRVIEAEHGHEAIELAERERPDVLLLDIHNPFLAGMEACAQLRAESRWTLLPIIVMSGDVNPATIERAYAAGATEFLRKPIIPVELRARLSTILDLQVQMEENKCYTQQMEELAGERAQQLMHADRLVTLGTLASGIAHEINNPTTFIRGNAEMIRGAVEALYPVLEHACEHDIGDVRKARFVLSEFPSMIEDIIMGTERITAIVRGVKQFAHKSTGFISIINVNSCVEDSLALCRHKLKNSVTIETELHEGGVPIQGDSQQIDQILTNLITNAADAMQGSSERRLMIRTSHDGTTATITVEDTGTGIPPKVMKKMWDPFYTTKEVGKGTGLGLSLVMRIVEDHSGTILARSRSGKGTVFKLTFPVASTAMQPKGDVEEGSHRQAA